MWVYFNVPEVRYLEFKAGRVKSADNSRLELVNSRIELVLADGSTFDQSAGNVVTVEGKFNNENGNIAFAWISPTRIACCVTARRAPCYSTGH